MSQPNGTIVAIDTETNGLNWKKSRVIELAWMAGDMSKPEVLFPYDYDGEYGLTMSPKKNVWTTADPDAMKINKFYERYPNGVKRSSDADFARFFSVVTSSTIMGANVQFDARMMYKTFGVEPWHYRLFDISSWASGILGYDTVSSWSDITKFLGLTGADHSAAGDCLTVSQAYGLLRGIQRTRATILTLAND